MSVIRKTEDVVLVTPELIDQLSVMAIESERGKSVALLHKSDESQIHEMLIALNPGTFVDRHRTRNESESIFVLRGSIALALFSANGEITQEVKLANDNCDGIFGLRVQTNQWISYLTGDEVAVIHEIACGPFKTGNSEVWALTNEERNVVGQRLMAKLVGDD